jgi:hypothetical protein
MQEQRRAFVVCTVLLCVLLSVVIFAQKTGTSPLPQPPTGSSPILELEPTYIDRAVRGTSVSITVTPDGRTLFVAVVDKEDGLRIYRIPVRSVP